jgi:DNA-binding Xre family transcriptional regulator
METIDRLCDLFACGVGDLFERMPDDSAS